MQKLGDNITIIFEADEVLTSQIASINSNNTEITSINEGLLTKYYAKYVMENTDNEGEINFEIIMLLIQLVFRAILLLKQQILPL